MENAINNNKRKRMWIAANLVGLILILYAVIASNYTGFKISGVNICLFVVGVQLMVYSNVLKHKIFKSEYARANTKPAMTEALPVTNKKLYVMFRVMNVLGWMFLVVGMNKHISEPFRMILMITSCVLLVCTGLFRHKAFAHRGSAKRSFFQ